MLGCVTATHPFYLILELCEDNLLRFLRAKAKLLQQQRATEQAQLLLGYTVNCIGFAGRLQWAGRSSEWLWYLCRIA